MSSTSKVFRKALKVVAVAAVIWFTAGTASAYMAAPQAGIGAAMSSSAASMYTTTASVFAGAGAAPSAVGLEGAAGIDIGATTLGADMASVGAQTGAVSASAPIVGTELAAGTAGVDIGATSLAGDLAAAEGVAAGGSAAGGGFTGWMAANPVPATVLGTGLLGAATAAMSDDDSVDKRDYGLGGFDRSGEYTGQPSGIVASQQKQDTQQVDSSRVAAPIVAGQMNQAVQPAQQKRPVERKNLPQLQKQGLVAQQQQQVV